MRSRVADDEHDVKIDTYYSIGEDDKPAERWGFYCWECGACEIGFRSEEELKEAVAKVHA